MPTAICGESLPMTNLVAPSPLGEGSFFSPGCTYVHTYLTHSSYYGTCTVPYRISTVQPMDTSRMLLKYQQINVEIPPVPTFCLTLIVGIRSSYGATYSYAREYEGTDGYQILLVGKLNQHGHNVVFTPLHPLPIRQYGSIPGHTVDEIICGCGEHDHFAGLACYVDLALVEVLMNLSQMNAAVILVCIWDSHTENVPF